MPQDLESSRRVFNLPTYTYVYMGTKTITITDEAYRKLKSEKLAGESFSEVIKRLTDKRRRDLRDFAGTWQAFDAEPILQEGRKKFAKDAELLP
jgi:predicted CopG family antitoxin